VPFVIGLGGSVAVGKSTTARVLQALLARWPDHPNVDLVTTDGFLRPNRVLEERGIMDRKGFPESYDVRRLIQFLQEVKRGEPEVHAPVYSHVVYDIVEGEEQVLRDPDIVIVEGLNVLQTGASAGADARFVSDWFDFSIYVDADEADIERWYVERFFALRATAFSDETSFFRHFAALSDGELEANARSIWASINQPNLRENILPSRSRADLVLHKGPDHGVRTVHLRMR
jgi:type I pantothenate kinase